MMEKIKPKTSIKYMEKMGVTTLTNKDNSLPLSLGGLEKVSVHCRWQVHIQQ